MESWYEKLLSNSTVQGVLGGAANSFIAANTPKPATPAPVQSLAPTPAPTSFASSMDMKTLAMWGGVALAVVVGVVVFLKRK